MLVMRRSDVSVLPLVLKGEWYDKIARGEKREEYRAYNDYWVTRVKNWRWDDKEKVVEFRRGYGSGAPRMAFVCSRCCVRSYALKRELGEPFGIHYDISLDAQVELIDDLPRAARRKEERCESR